MYGTFPDSHVATLAPLLRHRTVFDLGSGDGARAAILRSTRVAARQVVEVDVAPSGALEPGPVLAAPFWRAADLLDQSRDYVAYLAWPVNRYAEGLDELLADAALVVLVACTTGGAACGTPELFAQLRRRAVRAYVPDPTNTLIVYGDGLAAPRARVHHVERAGLDLRRVYGYDGTMELFEV